MEMEMEKGMGMGKERKGGSIRKSTLAKKIQQELTILVKYLDVFRDLCKADTNMQSKIMVLKNAKRKILKIQMKGAQYRF